YAIREARATAAELPAETTPFANALGFAGRSMLENNAAGLSHSLGGAHTDTTGIPFTDAARLVGAEKDWVLWHHWPDSRIHDLAAAGQGIERLCGEIERELLAEPFWSLVDRLATGRSLVITSDHGYAASG